MTIFGLAWLALVLIVLGYEAYTIYSRRPNDTLSEQVWGLARHSRSFVGVISATLAWLAWHFIIEPRFFPGLHLTTFVDDISLAIAFHTLGWAIGPIKNAGKVS